MTAQGHPRAIFTRAIERGNLALAEQVAREVPNLTLEEARALHVDFSVLPAQDPLTRAGVVATGGEGGS